MEATGNSPGGSSTQQPSIGPQPPSPQKPLDTAGTKLDPEEEAYVRRWSPARSTQRQSPAERQAEVDALRSMGGILDPQAVKQARPDNPDFDDLVIDDEYYKELGISPEEVEASRAHWSAKNVDPEGIDLDLDTLASLGDSLPPELRAAVLSSEEMYGPETVILAGFRAEELGMVRALLDSAGGHVVRAIPATQAMLQGSVADAIQQPEPDWGAPRPERWVQGGGWGAQRVVLFSGLNIKVQATLLELLEASGLPLVCAAMARRDSAHRVLGQVLAEAVAAQRGRDMPKQQPWQQSSRMSDAKKGSGLTPLEQLLDPQRVRSRMEALPSNPSDPDPPAPRAASATGPAPAAPTRSAPRPSAGPNGVTAAGGVDARVGGDSGEASSLLRGLGLRGIEGVADSVRRAQTEEELARVLVDLPGGAVAGDALGSSGSSSQDGGNFSDGGAAPSPAAGPATAGSSSWGSGWARRGRRAVNTAAAAAAAASSVRASAGGGAMGSASGIGEAPVLDQAQVQQQRWQAKQEELESVAAAQGRLVVEAESLLLPPEAVPEQVPGPEEARLLTAFYGPSKAAGERRQRAITAAAAAVAGKAAGAPAAAAPPASSAGGEAAAGVSEVATARQQQSSATTTTTTTTSANRDSLSTPRTSATTAAASSSTGVGSEAPGSSSNRPSPSSRYSTSAAVAGSDWAAASSSADLDSAFPEVEDVLDQLLQGFELPMEPSSATASAAASKPTATAAAACVSAPAPAPPTPTPVPTSSTPDSKPAPEPAAASSSAAAAAKSPATAGSSGAVIGTPSVQELPVLAQLQAAMGAGASPEELKRLVDEAYRAMNGLPPSDPTPHSGPPMAAPAATASEPTAADQASMAGPAPAAGQERPPPEVVYEDTGYGYGYGYDRDEGPGGSGGDEAEEQAEGEEEEDEAQVARMEAALAEWQASVARRSRGSIFRRTLVPPPTFSSGDQAPDEGPGQRQQERQQQGGGRLEASGSARSGGGSAQQAEAQGAPKQQPQRVYGPEPLSPEQQMAAKMKPLFEMKPDVAKAIVDKRVRMLDLSKLNERQQQQFMQAQDEARARRAGVMQQPAAVAAAAAAAAVAGAAAAAGTVSRAPHGRGSQQQEGEQLEDGQAYHDDGEGSMEYGEGEYEEGEAGYGEDDDEGGMGEGEGEEEEEVDEEEDADMVERLQQLATVVKEQGLDLEQALADTIALGVPLTMRQLEMAGLPAPRASVVEAARSYMLQRIAEDRRAAEAELGGQEGQPGSTEEQADNGLQQQLTQGRK